MALRFTVRWSSVFTTGGCLACRTGWPGIARHGNQIVAEFNDARSFVACMNGLLDEALDSWEAYLDDYKRVVMDRVPALPVAATPLMADTPVS